MNRRVGVLTVAAAVVAISALPGSAAAHTKTVFAGPPPAAAKKLEARLLGKQFLKKYNPDVNDFFLHRVTVNQGDTVSFVLAGFHTVDLPGASGKDVTLLVPGPTATGVKDAAGNPFWFNGHLPTLGLNPALFAASGPATYDGSARIDSGLPLGPPKPLNVTFTKPGTYKYFCDVHPGMIGFVIVKPTGAAVPSAKQDAAALTRQLKTDLKAAKKLSKPKLAPDHVSVGSSASHGVELYAMFPAKLTVAAGSVVTFSMSRHSVDAHTATFGPKPYLGALAKAFTTPVFPPAGTYPSSPKQPVPLNPKSHGNGFANIGIVDNDPTTTTIPTSGKIKFTKAGIYHYICLLHPFMRGTIVVTK